MAKELTISNQVATAISCYTGKLVSDLNFNELSGIIDKIANNKEELTDGMRAAATSYAEQWDELVVKRIDVKHDRLLSLKNFLTMSSVSYYNIEQSCCRPVYNYNIAGQDDPIVVTVIAMLRSSENKAWHKAADDLEAIVEKVETLSEEAAEERPKCDDYVPDERSMAYDDKVIAYKKFELATATFERELYQRQLKLRVEFMEAYRSLVKDPDIKEMIKVLKAQIKKIGNAKAVVHEKAALVKLAVNFGGTDLLKALQELHEFQQTI